MKKEKKKKKKEKKSMTHYFGRLPTNRHYTVPFFRRLTKGALAMLALVFLIALAMLVGKQLQEMEWDLKAQQIAENTFDDDDDDEYLQ